MLEVSCRAQADLNALAERLRAAVVAQDHEGALRLLEEFKAGFEQLRGSLDRQDPQSMQLVEQAGSLLRWCMKSVVAARAGMAGRRAALARPRAAYCGSHRSRGGWELTA
jgi:hypothetical protein